MLSWIIQISIISIIFIFLVHHLLCFFKTTLTVPKIKDLVNSPSKKYQQIFDTISNGNDSNANANANSYTELDLLPSATDAETNINTNNNANKANNANSMKNELKHFLKKQLNNEKETTLDTMSSNNNYAAFL
jgi:hypothetical protein